MEIPATGYAVEFCESTAAGFPRSAEIAKAAPTFTSCVRAGKTWYLAGWPGDRFEQVVSLAESLKGIRNRKVYLAFRKSGLLRNQVAWVFDKERIRHELNQNAHAVRFCPHLRPALISAVVDALPDEVTVAAKGPWKYKYSGEEVPGAIKVIEKEGDDEYAFTNEYWSDGVVPRGLDAARQILTKAFQQARITDVTVRQLTT